MARDSFSDRQKEYIFIKQYGKCGDCGKQLIGEWVLGGSIIKPKSTFTIHNGNIHHIVPIYKGGKHHNENWLLLCTSCHIQRHNILGFQDHQEYLKRINYAKQNT